MIYYIGELWHLAGFDFVTAMNLACVSVVLLSAAGMFLLARLYFGAAGGWLGAAAFLYAPYFAVDLYVRSAMAEFCALSVLRVCSLRIRSIRLASPLTTLAAGRSRICLRAVVSLSRGPTVHAPARGVPRSYCLDEEILADAVETGLRSSAGAGVERLRMGACAGGATVRGHEPHGGRFRAVLQPLCVPPPVVLLHVGLRAFRARPRRWHVILPGLEPSASGCRGLDLDLAHSPRWEIAACSVSLAPRHCCSAF